MIINQITQFEQHVWNENSVQVKDRFGSNKFLDHKIEAWEYSQNNNIAIFMLIAYSILEKISWYIPHIGSTSWWYDAYQINVPILSSKSDPFYVSQKQAFPILSEKGPFLCHAKWKVFLLCHAKWDPSHIMPKGVPLVSCQMGPFSYHAKGVPLVSCQMGPFS